MCRHTHATEHTWRAEDKLYDSVLSFLPMGSRIRNQAAGRGGQREPLHHPPVPLNVLSFSKCSLVSSAMYLVTRSSAMPCLDFCKVGKPRDLPVGCVS